MSNHLKFYIDGAWVDPVTPARLDVINPATEEAYTQISLGTKADVDKAVAAAKAAFETFSLTTRAERLALLRASSKSTTSASRTSRRRFPTKWARRSPWRAMRRPGPARRTSRKRSGRWNPMNFPKSAAPR